MYCTFCGKQIVNDSAFCPYCGKPTKSTKQVICPECGKTLKEDSLFCCYCGSDISSHCKSKGSSIMIPKIDIQSLLHSRFLKIYILWIAINRLLLYYAQNACSNYFNSTNVSSDHWSHSDEGIYPEDWLYPFMNIFSGIMGQDPIYVYDISEFIIYTIILPLVLSLCIYNRTKIFKTDRVSNTFYWAIWYGSIWMLIVFPMGLFGLDYLGWSFMMGGLILAIYSYQKTFAKLYNK